MAPWSHRLRFRLAETGPDNFGNRAVGRAEFQRALARLGNYRTSAGLNFRDIAVAILDFGDRTRSRYEPGAAPSVFLPVAIRGYSFHGSTAPRRVRLRPPIWRLWPP